MGGERPKGAKAQRPQGISEKNSATYDIGLGLQARSIKKLFLRNNKIRHAKWKFDIKIFKEGK